ncbi:unnamed protein product, partial [Allacma fusca]
REILASLTDNMGSNVVNSPASPVSPLLGPPNGACCTLAEGSDSITPQLQKNRLVNEAIMLSTPACITNACNLGRRTSCKNTNQPNIPRSGLLSHIHVGSIGTSEAEYLHNSTGSENDDVDDEDEDDDDGYIEHSRNKSNNRASRKESREAMLSAHSNSSSSITSESNVPSSILTISSVLGFQSFSGTAFNSISNITFLVQKLIGTIHLVNENGILQNVAVKPKFRRRCFLLLPSCTQF